MATVPNRTSLDRLRTPVLRRHRRPLQPSTLPPPLPISPLKDEEWPADDTVQSYLVGARPTPPPPAAPTPSPSPLPPPPPPRRFGRIRSAQSLTTPAAKPTAAMPPRVHRVSSHRAERGRVSTVFSRTRGGGGGGGGVGGGGGETKRCATEMEQASGDGRLSRQASELDNSCYSMAATVVADEGEAQRERGRALLAKTALQVGRRGEALQGYCRMAWFARLKCTRFVRLVRGTLQCYDANIRRRIWAVEVGGARVRVQVAQSKVVLSKLKGGTAVEMFLYDGESCREWGAALLRASSPAKEEEEGAEY